MEFPAPVIAALIAAAASLVVSVVNWITKRKSDRELARIQEQNQSNLARLNDALTRSREVSTAQLQYRAKAQQRLYEELQPLLFQLHEYSEVAYERVLLLAKHASRGRLGPNQQSWLADRRGYFALTTTYRLVAPLVVFRLMGLRLTLVDLSVDPEVWMQYRMAKLLYVSLTNGRGLADTDPQIPYEETKALQHLRTADLDRLIELMTLEKSDGSLYCMSYGRWVDAIERQDGDLHKWVEKVIDLLHDFHPVFRPVFWRVLLAHAHIHKAVMQTVQPERTRITLPQAAIPLEHRREFDWREPETTVPEKEAVTDPFEAVRTYLSQQMTLPGRRI
jgi:hypothetical protein